MFGPRFAVFNTEGTAAPNGAQPAPVTPPATPPAAATTAIPTADENPAWLPVRLEQAARLAVENYAKSLGITDPAKAKAALDAAKKAEEDAKSQGERLGETTKLLEEAKARADRYEGVTKEHAARQMGLLTDLQREAVRRVAPDSDPAAQLAQIDAMRPTWHAQPAPAGQPAPPAQPVPPASGTAPPPTAPPGTVVSPPNHKEIHTQLAKTNPFAAANYALEHLAEVFPEQTS